MPAGKRLKMVGQVARPCRSVRYCGSEAKAFFLRQFLAAQYVGGTLNNGQQIIEIMRDTARQLAERLHLLGLPKLFLRAATFGNFRFQLPLGVDQRLRLFFQDWKSTRLNSSP